MDIFELFDSPVQTNLKPIKRKAYKKFLAGEREDNFPKKFVRRFKVDNKSYVIYVNNIDLNSYDIQYALVTNRKEFDLNYSPTNDNNKKHTLEVFHHVAAYLKFFFSKLKPNKKYTITFGGTVSDQQDLYRIAVRYLKRIVPPGYEITSDDRKVTITNKNTMVETTLTELRRNPELNKKLTVFEQLSKYAGQKDVFVSFTENVGRMSHPTDWSLDMKQKSSNTHGHKIGINPRSNWKYAPYGIFAYPIDYVLSQKGDMPFAAGRPYLYVFKAIGNFIDIDAYSYDDLERDSEKLPMFGINRNEFLKNAIGLPAKYLFFNCLRKLVTKESKSRYSSTTIDTIAWSKLIRQLGYDGILDYGGYNITPDIKAQAVFFTIKSIKPLEVIDNKTHWLGRNGVDK
jgi:hypothetical protein